ncbi:hypothetical protein GJ496_010091 [Pomphorhynchus laevis]|nr:hypothetical protein GJ496_010091 [Pomphorhynchus laevis]
MNKMTVPIAESDVKDVDMTPAEVSNKDALSEKQVILEELKDHLRTIEKTVITKETHYILRILRRIAQTRKRLQFDILQDLIEYVYAPYPLDKETSLAFLNERKANTDLKVKSKSKSQILPEIDSYVQLLIVLYFIDIKKYKSALNVSHVLVNKLLKHNSRTLDLLTAKCLFYWYQCMEYCNEFTDIREILSLRLMKSTHNGDHEGIGMCLNLYLRYLIRINMYEQAQKLINRAPAPIQTSNSQFARYLFYAGRVQAVRLQYTTAFTSLTAAIRKAPQQGAIGFRQIAHKYLVVIQLLMGEIPEKSIFRQKHLSRCLLPYKQLVNAVRNGDISLFMDVLDKFHDQFIKDGIINLIIRLRHNVIRAGLRMISLSYSRITLADIAKKLHLEFEVDAENVVSKAIRDGVIFGVIHKREGYLETMESHNIYFTKEPSKSFDKRIRFCLDTHAKSVKALRFPPKKYYDNLETSKERFEKEREALEYAKEMVEEDEDDFA